MALNLGRQNNIVMDQDFREARNNSLTRSVLRELRDVLLEGLGHHGLRPGQVLGADLAPLEPQAEPHPLEDLHVVVDLEGVVEVEEVLVLVVRDAAVDLGRLGRVDDDEGQLDGRVGRRWAALHLLALLVPLHEVLEGDLLQYNHSGLKNGESHQSSVTNQDFFRLVDRQ